MLAERRRQAMFSIAPVHVDAIASGLKRWEFRRVRVTLQPEDNVLIYATAPVSSVVARFRVGGVVMGTPEHVAALEEDPHQRCVASDYLEGSTAASAIEVRDFAWLPEPQGIHAFGLQRPPLSYVFVS